ncbi:MAG: dual specificity protein phosphatase family protein [Myxococcales bacterium]|nr:dual specificity protein phosphatase family protein [Myxococcales bacterium]
MWRIDHRLYLGDYESGYAALRGDEVGTEPEGSPAPFAGVVSLCRMPLFADLPTTGPLRDETEWLQVPIVDGGNGEHEFESALGVALPFIRRRIPHGNVLVHCAAGMSRSVSVIAALLCADQKHDVDAAFDHIAAAKTAALAGTGLDASLMISPAWEFRACLHRLYGAAR